MTGAAAPMFPAVDAADLTIAKAIMARREQFEVRLGHYLAAHPIALDISRRMAQASLRYLRARARRVSSDPRARRRALHVLFAKVMRPVALPFSGRTANIKEMFEVLSGNGSIRELQGSIWLVMAHVLAEDLVSAETNDEAMECACAAELDCHEIETWIQHARRYKDSAGDTGPLRPQEDLIFLPWHPIRQVQRESRQIFSRLHEKQRHWSMLDRARFLDEGGSFSPIEQRRRSPLGACKVPWLDARRFTRPNDASAFVRSAYSRGIPLCTGASGVATHIAQFARILQVKEADDVLLAALGYLMSTKAHSYYEILFSMQSHHPLEMLPYEFAILDRLDRSQVESACGRLAT